MPQGFGEPSPQQSNFTFLPRPCTHRNQIIAAQTRGRKILDLERCTERLDCHNPLQINRQPGDRELGVLEFLAGINPLLLIRVSKPFQS